MSDACWLRWILIFHPPFFFWELRGTSEAPLKTFHVGLKRVTGSESPLFEIRALQSSVIDTQSSVHYSFFNFYSLTYTLWFLSLFLLFFIFKSTATNPMLGHSLGVWPFSSARWQPPPRPFFFCLSCWDKVVGME